MACGEGYGSDILARTGAPRGRRGGQPGGLRSCPPALPSRPNLRFARGLVETFSEPADAVVFLQTIEHLQDPSAVLRHFKSLVGEQGLVFVSTPNVLTLAPKGAERSDNPWHVHEYRSEEFEMLCRDTFAQVEMYGLFHARKLRRTRWP